ncbi:MAG: hypothetical protein E1N59_2181 [Puniceicoccaceae bacterium 5H]|nr:MAG: hypothetical protein E1N59_2181 [Puniceicoccaceae bacterium 5H]
MQRFLFVSLLGALSTAPSAQAIILYGQGNNATTSDPGTGAPFGNVARMTNNNGSLTYASAVYLGNGWVLSARHAGVPNYVQFDVGGALYSRDQTADVVTFGNSDLIMTRLQQNPGLPSLNLYRNGTFVEKSGTVVGWGIGRSTGSALESDTVAWGGDSTATKRWGLNAFEGALSYTDGNGRTTESFVTIAGNSDVLVEPPQYSPNSFQGGYEAVAAHKDSGSAYFTQEFGTWYLSGITLAVETPEGGGQVTEFGVDYANDENRGFINVYADLAEYADGIDAVVNPGGTIPEPASGALAFGLAALGALGFRQRRRS